MPTTISQVRPKRNALEVYHFLIVVLYPLKAFNSYLLQNNSPKSLSKGYQTRETPHNFLVIVVVWT
jgi:hypothetical protein